MALAAPQRLLGINPTTGGTQEVPAVTSGGTANAYAFVVPGATGQFDASLMPPGVAADQQTLAASETISAGAAVATYVSSGTTLARNANAATGLSAIGYVTGAVASGGTATVLMNGINPTPSVVGSAITAAAGQPVFLSDVTPGAVTLTPVTSAGHILQNVGTVVSGGQVQFNPQPPITRN